MRITWSMGLWALSLTAVTFSGSGCMATRKYTRNEVKASETRLSTRIDRNAAGIETLESNAKEMNDRLTVVDGRSKDNTQQIAGVKTELSRVDARAADAGSLAVRAQDQAVQAQSAASAASTSVAALDQQFRNRNNHDAVTEKHVPFRFNSAVLDEIQAAGLDEVARLLKSNADAFVVLEGRTDAAGDDDYNIKLGDRRVDAVMRHLVVELGIPLYKVFQLSFGEKRPVASNESRDGRQKNRSVVVRVFAPRDTVTAAR